MLGERERFINFQMILLYNIIISRTKLINNFICFYIIEASFLNFNIIN